MTDTHAADFLFFTHLGKHLGVLGVEYVLVDKDGRDKDRPQMQTYSGFFIVLDNQWYFVTAGHAKKRGRDSISGQEKEDATRFRSAMAATDGADDGLGGSLASARPAEKAKAVCDLNRAGVNRERLSNSIGKA